MTNHNAETDIDLDLKIVRVIGLTYFVYGLVYFFQISVFLVPLPIVFIVVPIAAIFMFLRSWKSKEAIMLLILPIIILKDLWMLESPKLMEALVLLVMLLWAGWGTSFIVQNSKKHLNFAVYFGVAQMFVILLLLPIPNVISFVLLGLIFAITTFFIRKNIENKEAQVVLRIGLLVQLMLILLGLQELSILSATS